MIKGCLNLDLKGNVVSPYGLLIVGVVKGVNVGIWPVETAVTNVVRVSI